MEMIIDIIHEYAKELFALLIPFITWMLNNIYKAKAKLHLANPHHFSFLIQEPRIDTEGNQISPTQGANTSSYLLTNVGRETATNVEVVFNWKPLCINIWPSRHFSEHTEEDKRYVMVFESLAPNEHIGFELLTVNDQLPNLVNARSDQCPATNINMQLQPILPLWIQRLIIVLLFLGFACAIYISILILQFLILTNT